jgi:hypothetical protein
MIINQSSDITKFFNELIVTKDKVKRLREYYLEIVEGIVRDYTAFKNRLIEDIEWLQNKLDELHALYIDLKNTVESFTDKSATPEEIVDHAKYLEMIALYNIYIEEFYNRMNELYDIYKENFLSSKINDIHNEWKYHYSNNKNDAVRIEHEYASININENSQLVEVSDNRYILYNGDNAIYDINYRTKDCYVTIFDSKTVNNTRSILQGSLPSLYNSENAFIKTIFAVDGKDSVYLIIDHGFVGNDYNLNGDILGDSSDGFTHILSIAKYNINDHTILLSTNQDNTSPIYIKDNVLNNNKINIIKEAQGDFYYMYIGNYIARIKIDGVSNNERNLRIIFTATKTINNAAIHQNKFLIFPIEDRIIRIYNLESPGDYYTFNAAWLSSQLPQGDSGVVHSIMPANDGIYFTTEKALWFTYLDAAGHYFNPDRIERDIRINNFDAVSFSDYKRYKMSKSGILFYISNRLSIYKFTKNNPDGIAVPSRYANALFLFENDFNLSREGYVHINGGDGIPDENIIYSYIDGGSYVGISNKGRVFSSNIVTGEVFEVRESIINNEICTSCCLDEKNGVLFIGTYSGSIYYIVKDDIYSSSASLLCSTNMGGIYAFCIHKGVLYIAGYNGRVSSYDLVNSVYYPYNRGESKYIVNSGSAVGNVNIKDMAVVKNDLIVAGNNGRAASCNMTTKRWTRYDGSSEDDDPSIDSKIYNDGQALGNENINRIFNYKNQYLILFGKDGRIASCALKNGAWTSYEGNDLDAGREGPGIYSRGSHSNGCSIRDVVLTNKGIAIANDNGTISSLDPETKGITKYDGVDESPEKKGPGISYDGFELNTDLLSIIFDIKRSNVIVSGKKCIVRTLSINENSMMSPVINKLYYSSFKGTKNDYLSSYFVELSQETLQEKRILFPPYNSKDVYTDLYKANYYVFKKGKIVYKLHQDFSTISQSVDGGKTFVDFNIYNKNWYVSIFIMTVNSVKAFISDDGTLGLYIVINGVPHILFVHLDGGSFHASWYDVNLNDASIDDFGLLQSDEVPDKYLFYTILRNETTGKTYPAVLKLSDLGNKELMFNSELAVKMNEYLTNNNYPGIDDNIHISMDANGNVFTSNESYLNIFKWTYIVYGLFSRINNSINPVFIDGSKFIESSITARKYNNYVDNGINCFLGFNAVSENTFNLMYFSSNGNILFITVCALKDRIDVSDINDTSHWSINFNEINSHEYIPLDAHNKFMANNNIALSKIKIEKKYSALFNGNSVCLIGVDISYWDYEVEENRYGYHDKHLIISSFLEKKGNFIIPEYRIYKLINGKGEYLSHDGKDKTLLVASYNTKADIILDIGSIHRFKLVDSSMYTPIRSLQDAWYTQSFYIKNDIDFLTIRSKINHLNIIEDINKNLAFRYEVLITNETTGQYILYEAEKSIINSRFDRDSKTLDTVLKVKAIDNFEDDIIELYNSRLANRQTAFVRVPPAVEINPFTKYFPKEISSYDFSAIIKISANNKRKAGENGMVYSIKIRPINALPSTFDVQFYIEPGFNNGVYGVKSLVNNIKRSEYYTALVENDINKSFDFSDASGFLSETDSDIPHITNMLHTTNHDLLPQYDANPYFLRKGYADTLASYIKGRGNGRYDRLDGIITNVGKNEWVLMPYSINRKKLSYYFDSAGTKHIRDSFDVEFMKNGRNISKMHEFGIYGPNIINSADYYNDLNGEGRIAKSDGLLLSPYGLFEGISTLDGKQKRITNVHELREDDIYRYVHHGLDTIRDRKYGYAYDFVDRYTLYEIPYYYIRAWWISAKGFIKQGNESLLTLDYTTPSSYNIGKALFPFDPVNPPPSISKPDYENGGGGIGSGAGSIVVDPNALAFSELMYEKRPLTHWDGYEDLDFVWIYDDIYVDGHVEIREVIEKPQIIPRNLYSYEDNLNWEMCGKEIIKYMTGYYYNAYDYKVYYHEVREIVSGYTDQEQEDVDKDEWTHVYDYNSPVVKSDTYTELQWYVNEKPEGSGAWPIDTAQIVGERIANITNPLVDAVFFLNANPFFISVVNGEEETFDKTQFEYWRRGKMEYRDEFSSRGHRLYYLRNPGANKKTKLNLQYIDSDTSNGDCEDITNKLNELISSSENYTVLLIMYGSQSISAQLRDALKKIGAQSYTTWDPSYMSHFILGNTKPGRSQIEHTGVLSTYYPYGYGYIAPLRTADFNYDDIEAINENTPWVASVKKYRADCNESFENRNMTTVSGNKYYDRYAGYRTHKYLYATKKTISLYLNGINPRTQSKEFYYYTVENGSPALNSYYPQFTHWWDRRIPANNPNNKIVEREYLDRIEPTDEDKRVGYRFREWLDNGESREVIDYYDYFTKWFELTLSSVLTIPIDDELAEKLDEYTISGTEKYEWYDGTILPVPRTSTFAYLKSNFGLTIDIDISYDAPTDDYNIKRQITFTGPKADGGNGNTFINTWVTTATYTINKESPEGALKSTTTGTRAIKWG